jgi:hypothetical protein
MAPVPVFDDGTFALTVLARDGHTGENRLYFLPQAADGARAPSLFLGYPENPPGFGFGDGPSGEIKVKKGTTISYQLDVSNGCWGYPNTDDLAVWGPDAKIHGPKDLVQLTVTGSADLYARACGRGGTATSAVLHVIAEEPSPPPPSTTTTVFYLKKMPTYEGIQWFHGVFPGIGTLKGVIQSVNVPAESGQTVHFLLPAYAPPTPQTVPTKDNCTTVGPGDALKGDKLTVFTGTPAKSIDVYAACSKPVGADLGLTITVTT